MSGYACDGHDHIHVKLPFDVSLLTEGGVRVSGYACDADSLVGMPFVKTTPCLNEKEPENWFCERPLDVVTLVYIYLYIYSIVYLRPILAHFLSSNLRQIHLTQDPIYLNSYRSMPFCGITPI